MEIAKKSEKNGYSKELAEFIKLIKCRSLLDGIVVKNNEHWKQFDNVSLDVDIKTLIKYCNEENVTYL